MTSDWSGSKTPREIFLSALEKGNRDHPTVIALRRHFPDAWSKALTEYEEKNKVIPEFIERGE